MSLPIPLTVRLQTSRGDRMVTREVRDLSFRWAVPGGYASCMIDLDRPLHLQPGEVGYYGGLTVYDARNASVVFTGRVEDLGRSAGRDGQVWQITAIGPAAHASDRTVALNYVDRRLSAWPRATASSGEQPNAQLSAVDDPGGTTVPALTFSFPASLTVPTNGACTAVYLTAETAGQEIAVIDYAWDTGLTSASWEIRAFFNGTVFRTDTANTAGGATSTRVVGTNWTAGETRPYLQFRWTGAPASTGTSDVTWAALRDIVVRTITYSAAGVKKTTGYTSADKTILASTVVADLLGRLLTQYDGATASIATTSYAIDQLAYPDGVTPAKVLDDLLTFHPDHYWAAWEKTAAGKHRFEWTQWPTTPRYEATIVDGFDSPGSATELWNAVTVRGRDAAGNIQTVRRTSTVPALDAAGLIRETFVDLGDEVWSTTNANRAGDQFLAEHKYPPNAGRLTVARKILDLQTGRMASPWEIRPGLIRVRGVQPTGQDALNIGRNGYTIFRVVGSDYQSSSNSAVLELDSRPRTLPQILADAARAPRRRRR